MKKAFTLIELLVVIAIISILAALIFPVFSSAQENAREQSDMEHLHAIQSGLALYKLDNKSYPGSLFGYVGYNSQGAMVPMSDAADIGKTNQQLGTLYPTYVNDYHDFMSSDDQNTSITQTVSLDVMAPVDSLTYPYAPVTTPCTNYPPTADNPPTPAGYTVVPSPATCDQIAPKPQAFYTADAMDISPQITAPGQPNGFTASPSNPRYVLRYDLQWTSMQALDMQLSPAPPPLSPLNSLQFYTTYGDPNGQYFQNYVCQMRWQQPPANASVTSLTYHYAKADQVLILFENGSVKRLHIDQLGQHASGTEYNVYDDSTSCYNTVGGTETCNLDINGDNPAKFWKVSNID